MPKFMILPLREIDVFVLENGVAIQRCSSFAAAVKFVFYRAGLDVEIADFPSDALFKLLSKKEEVAGDAGSGDAGGAQ